MRTNKYKHLRQRSQRALYSHIKASEAVKPLDEKRVERMKDMAFTIKLCDMGNACYIDEHFSDII